MTSWKFVLLSVTAVLLTANSCDSLALPDFDGMTSVVNYTRHKVIRLTITSKQQLETLQQAEEDLYGELDVWKESSNGSATLIDLHVTPGVYDQLTSRLVNASISFDIMFDDLQRAIDEQLAAELLARKPSTAAGRQRRRRRQSPSKVDFHNSDEEHDDETGEEDDEDDVMHDVDDDHELHDIVGTYASHGQINNWLRYLEQQLPRVARVIEIGLSSESRQLLVIKIGEPSNSVKPAIWVDAGIHAREWIAPATAVYFIHELIVGYQHHDPEVMTLIRQFDWYILPVVNPDGYNYSRTTDRMWRKTRSRVGSSRNRCVGVDGNRNFDFQWLSECDSTTTRCRGRDPCENVYAGRRGLSEPETIALANFIHNHRSTIKFYLTLHSYSQLWLTPWGYTADEPPDNEDLMRVARRGALALEAVHQTEYNVGSPALILYAATGGSYDWAKGKEGIKYSYTIELRDTGRHGFLLPVDQIIPTGQETWAGVKAAVREMVNSDPCWVYGRGCRTVAVGGRGNRNNSDD